MMTMTRRPNASSAHAVSSFLASIETRGMRLDLEPLRLILKRLGDPHRMIRSVLVAGTNGKGSTAAMLASILSEAGLRVGLYTSPHLIDFRERIRINGEMVTWDELRDLLDEAMPCLDDATTYFEFATIAAFLLFRRRRVDVAVLEVGMGGRLDATNVVNPDVSIITNISLEHGQYLGHTLAAITREKAGIIREDGVCITASGHSKVLATLRDICEERHATLLRVGGKIRALRNLPEGTFTYSGLMHRLSGLALPLRGRHQLRNAATALLAAEVLSQRGLPLDEEVLRRGLAKTQWAGRLEQLLEQPRLIVDGAHNPAGTAVLADALRHDYSYRRLILIVGILKDKAVGTMLRRLAPLASLLILTGLETQRSQDPEILAAAARPYAQRIVVKKKTEAALAYALTEAGSEDLICAAGSLFLVGEVKKIIQQRDAKSLFANNIT